MKIRSITSFYDPGSSHSERNLLRLGQASENIKAAVSSFLPVQSTRLATSPFPYYLRDLTDAEMREQVKSLEQKSAALGWQYLSLGPALPGFPWSYDVIPDLIKATENTFFSAVIADGTSLYPAAVLAASRVIHQTARATADGFANLRFAALANVGPWTPFLPAAYHRAGSTPAISIAIECADAVLDAFSAKHSLEACRQHLLDSLTQTASDLGEIIQPILAGFGIKFKGFDFSPAPFPGDWCSLGAAAERLGLAHIGGIGSLAAVAFIADTLDRGSWRKAGFNGMMLPLLEDSVLANRAAEGLLSIKDLLLYSSLCGTGLDTIPLAGDTTVDQLRAVLMDIGAMSIRLGKPLTARLMPIPGKSAGDLTEFDFPFFANSRVLALEGQPLERFFTQADPINIRPRRSNRSNLTT